MLNEGFNHACSLLIQWMSVLLFTVVIEKVAW